MHIKYEHVEKATASWTVRDRKTNIQMFTVGFPWDSGHSSLSFFQPRGSSWPPHILTGLLTSTQHKHTHTHLTGMCEAWTRKCEMRHLGNIQAYRREQQSPRQAVDVREVVFAEHQTVGKDNSPLLRLNGTGWDRGAKVSVLAKIRICKSSRVNGRVRIQPKLCQHSAWQGWSSWAGYRSLGGTQPTFFSLSFFFFKLQSECTAPETKSVRIGTCWVTADMCISK